jgi:hypothetical protein
MLKYKNKLLVVLLIAFLFTLSGCKEKEAKPVKSFDVEVKVFIVDGQEIECIVFSNGLSCNWVKYNKLKKAT